MKVVELFAGTGHISQAFRERGHEAFTIDWNAKVNPTLQADIAKLTPKDIIDLCGGVPDVIWASPDCTTYSIAAMYRHRRRVGDVLLPKTEYAAFCDYVNVHLWHLIKELVAMGTKYYFVENPRGGYRKGYFLDIMPHDRHTITYCQYGNINMKPTDIFTNHSDPQFLPMCKNGDTCHEASPRGSKTGTQGAKWWSATQPGLTRALTRGLMPKALCEHIATISERDNTR